MKEEQFFEAFSNIDSKYIDDTKLYTAKRRVPIWLKLLPILLLIICCLIYYQSGYHVYEEDGSYYITFRGPRAMIEKLHYNKFYKYYTSHCTPVLYFDSAESVEEDILSGNFSHEEMSLLRRSYSQGEQIEISDLDKLCKPIFTECDGYQVVWRGSFSYMIDCSDRADYIKLTLSTEGEMMDFATKCNNFGHKLSELITTYPDPSTSGTVYYWRTTSGYDKYAIVYTISDAEKTVYVLEEYNDDPAISPPSNVDVYGVSNDVYYRLQISNPKERPSAQWLFSFGLIPLS